MSKEYVLKPFRPVVDLHIDYERELNPQQAAAVTAPPGPALVLAGAGAGKTRTLIYRVAFLLEQGIPAERILLLTFTNKAAKEMMRRVTDLLGGDPAGLWGGTFHSVGHRILRRHAEQIGYRGNFTILDREDARDLLKACLADSGLETSDTRFPKPDLLGDIYSLGVNTGQSIAEIVGQYHDHFTRLIPQIETLGKLYQERKQRANVMDFDDLLVLWRTLLREHPQVCDHYQRAFQFVLVDEYQDTNVIQADLVDLLGARHQNVMVVGDDSQSIYSWRGANFQNILQFPRRYPKARVFKIETNYRSTPEILQLANAAIQGNACQFEKELAPVRASGIKPVVVTCGNATQQAAFVAQRLLELREEGRLLQDMAVLYRSHFHALELQLELTRRNIPFSITSGIRFFEQAHVKDVAAHLKLICNPGDELAFKRLVRLMPGVGGKGAEILWAAFRRKVFDDGGSATPAQPPRLAEALQACASVAPKKAARAWTEFAILVSQLEAEEVRTRPGRMIEIVLEGSYEDHLKATYSNHRIRLEDLEQLATFALGFAGTEEFLTQLALLTNVEAEQGTGNADQEQVRLSTIHQAKGLEFGVVFVIMLCEGLFPSARSLDMDEDAEEERRLFYVSVTRAKDEVYLSYPQLRMLPGGGREMMQEPSRFLNELPDGLVDQWMLSPFGASH